jgi:5-methyltetrahydropteroyltriglutamate--homocysteine methyltransferase
VFGELPLKSHQSLIVGAIDTTTNFVEHPEVIADRLEAAAKVIGDPHRIMAGTDCGFDTSAGMGRLTADVVWAKLRTLRAGADLAAARLL